MSSKITRSSYAEMFGPTTGDKVRLADTDLFIEVENDSGKIVSIVKQYKSFNDPEIPIKEEIRLLTGIGDDMVKNKSIEASTILFITCFRNEVHPHLQEPPM